MSTDHLDHAPAALLRYLYDGRRSGIEVGRLLEMGMVTLQELSELVAELERRGMVRASRQSSLPEVQITERGISWVRFHHGDV